MIGVLLLIVDAVRERSQGDSVTIPTRKPSSDAGTTVTEPVEDYPDEPATEVTEAAEDTVAVSTDDADATPPSTTRSTSGATPLHGD